MAFLSGRSTFARFRITGAPPGIFGPDHLERLEAFRAGRSRIASMDGVEVGWTAGDHILDTRFNLEKNVVNESLHFCLRVDTQKIPADMMRAYYQIELDGRAAGNPSGKPSSRNKKEAKEAARAKLEEEARDGRYLKRKAIPAMWDAKSNELLIGTTSANVVDQFHSLFEQSFGIGFEPISAGRQAFALAELHGSTRGIDDASPSIFIQGLSPNELAWISDPDSRDFIGNEYLLWLWFILEIGNGTIIAADNSEIAVMLARTLTLECPRGQTGHETISSDGPTRLPEARRAIQSGKMPRKVGMTVVRHDNQFGLALQAESLAVNGAKLPPVEGEEERARLEGRIDLLRALIETLDLMFDAFIRHRASDGWPQEMARLQKWLAKKE